MDCLGEDAMNPQAVGSSVVAEKGMDWVMLRSCPQSNLIPLLSAHHQLNYIYIASRYCLPYLAIARKNDASRPRRYNKQLCFSGYFHGSTAFEEGNGACKLPYNHRLFSAITDTQHLT